MRYLLVIAAIVLMFNTGIAAAQGSDKGAAQQSTEQQNIETPIVVDENEGVSNAKEAGVGEETAAERVYDENTGLPDVVESDKEGEIGW